MSPGIGYFLRWRIGGGWDIMAVETIQRHLQMLLIVSSFGESRRRANHPAAALLKREYWKYDHYPEGLFIWTFFPVYFLPVGIAGLLTGKTIKKVLPCPRFDSTQMRPWWASTMLLTIASPKPDPSLLSMLRPR